MSSPLPGHRAAGCALFMVADRLVQYMGMTQALFASMLLVAARFAGYMLVPNVWLGVPRLFVENENSLPFPSGPCEHPTASSFPSV